MTQIIRLRLRQDALPLLLYLLTFLVMSYPFVFQMGDHFPMDAVDTHTAMWQNWWVLESVTQGYDVNHSQLLFHPNGLDVTLQPRRWATFPLWSILYSLFDDPLAFNLTAMIGILFKAYGMYLVGLYLFKNRIPAWVCGAFYSFAANSLKMALQQPNTGATEWIPWFMLVFMIGLSAIKSGKQARSVIGLIVLAGLLYAMNIYMNLKIALFAMLLGGGFVLLYMLAHHLWKKPLFWLAMTVFGISAIGFGSPVLIPSLQSSNLEHAINDGIMEDGGADILSYLKADHSRPLNYMQSIASLRGEQLELIDIWGLLHIGLVSIVFALMGLLYGLRVDRTVRIWVILATVFWLLSLGLEFKFKRQAIDFYPTPYRLLENNIIFQILKWPWRMSLVFLFPYSILIGYGLHYRLRSLTLDRPQFALLILSVVMLLYGTSIFPIPSRPAPRPAYLDSVNSLPDGAIIDLPFGRQNTKYYMSVQRFHHRPIIEGMIARLPFGTYDYIDSNVVLKIIRGKSDLSIEDLSVEDWQSAFRQLQDDGFKMVILHKFVLKTERSIAYPEDMLLDVMREFEAIYEDEQVMIYDIDTLIDNPPAFLTQ